ncbi:MAG TPA: TetR/AcrR family transcriptional regulator C-terminal domain-containing protein [Gaiellaceae bacterium]|jgi:AcrR family transcriptional regulator|nr:TetR/AcrR family transcriptional regulator C-terminal domain-containing protein [Gaiellaceae bacterium]
MATTKRKPLSRERILGAALEVADEQGIEALSMRKLGQSLGYEAMSLYNHVANKDDLLDGILDLVLAEMEPPAADGGLPAVRAAAVSAHEALKRHPWAATMLMAPGRIRPARIAYMEALLASLRNTGMSAETTYHAYHVLDAHIIGFSLWVSTHGKMPDNIEDARAWFDEMIPVATLPYLHEHGLQHLDDGPHHDVSAFEFALDLLLGGFERLR